MNFKKTVQMLDCNNKKLELRDGRYKSIFEDYPSDLLRMIDYRKNSLNKGNAFIEYLRNATVTDVLFFDNSIIVYLKEVWVQ